MKDFRKLRLLYYKRKITVLINMDISTISSGNLPHYQDKCSLLIQI